MHKGRRGERPFLAYLDIGPSKQRLQRERRTLARPIKRGRVKVAREEEEGLRHRCQGEKKEQAVSKVYWYAWERD